MAGRTSLYSTACLWRKHLVAGCTPFWRIQGSHRPACQYPPRQFRPPPSVTPYPITMPLRPAISPSLAAISKYE